MPDNIPRYSQWLCHSSFLSFCSDYSIVPNGLRVNHKTAQVPNNEVLQRKWDEILRDAELKLLKSLHSHYEQLCRSCPVTERVVDWDYISENLQRKTNKISVDQGNAVNMVANRIQPLMEIRVRQPRNRRWRRNRRLRNSRVNTDKTVIDLTVDKRLTEDQKQVLGKGLGFAGQSREFNRQELLSSTANLCRRVEQASQYDNASRAFTSAVKTEIQNIKIARGDSNLTPRDNKAIKELAADRSIVIKPADKGRAVVAWERQHYVEEAKRQLGNATVYRRDAIDMTASFDAAIGRTLDALVASRELNQEQATKLKPNHSRTSLFYLLPKIHKQKTPCPGRAYCVGCSISYGEN